MESPQAPPRTRATGRERAYLAAALVASLLVKADLASRTSKIPPVWDEIRYIDVATELYVHDLDPRAFPGTFLTPVYPYFVATTMWLLGPRGPWVKLAQAAVSTLSALLLYFLGRSVAGPRAGAGAAIALAILPELVGLSHLYWSETLLIAFLVPALWMQHLHGRSGSLGAAAGAGILWGVATLVKPAYVYYPFVLAVVMGIQGYARGRGRRGIAAGALAASCFLLVLLPWFLRNEAVTGRFPILSTNQWINLWVGNKDRDTPAHARYRAVKDESEAEELARREALAWIRAQGARWLPIKLHRNVPALFGASNFSLRHLWLGAYGRFELRTARTVVVLSCLVYVPVMVLGILGFVIAPRDELKVQAALLVLLATLSHVVFEAITRYRAPLMVVVCLYLGVGLAEGLPGMARALRRPAAWVLLAILAYALVFSSDNRQLVDLWNGRTVRSHMAP